MTLAAVIQYQVYARRTAAFALMACLVAVVAYGAFLLLTVEKAASKEQYQAKAESANETLASLESHYLAQSAALTPQKAADLGLTPVPVAHIAYQETMGPELSMRK